MTYKIVPIAEVSPDKGNLREKVGDIKELTTSIATVGVVQPLLVRPNENGGYIVVAGHRRLAAAKRAKLDELPVIIQGMDGRDRVTTMLVENMQREDLTPVEEAQGYFQLTELGMSQVDVADAVGKSTSHISSRISLTNLPKKVQRQVGDQISLHDAETLAGYAETPGVVADIMATSLLENEWEQVVGVAQAIDNHQAAELLAEHLAKIQPAVDKLQELDVEVMGAGDDGPLTAGYGRPSEIPNSWKPLGKAEGWNSQNMDVPVKEHRTEECHVAAIVQHYSKIALQEWCRKPSRHKWTGKSELKVPDAEQAETTRKDLAAERKAEREQVATNQAVYRDVTGRRYKATDKSALFARAVVESAHHDLRVSTAKAMGLEPVKHEDKKGFYPGGNRPDWSAAFRNWAEEVGDERAALALLTLAEDPLDDGVVDYRYREIGVADFYGKALAESVKAQAQKTTS